ncbi:MAG: hypothetical protein R6X14_05735, partial [bacterium]
MEAGSRSLDARPGRRGLVFFVVAELLGVGGFVLGLAIGRPGLAAASLLLPLHLLMVSVLFRSNFLLLAFFSLVFPLSGIELLPHIYREVGLLAGILGLLAGVILAE